MSAQLWLDIRQALLAMVAAIERDMEYILTTAELRLWFKHYGPTEADAKEEVEAFKKAKAERKDKERQL